MKRLSKNNRFLKLVLLGLLLVIVIFMYGNYRTILLQKENQTRKESDLIKTRYLLKQTDILAKAFSVYDITDKKEIYSKNGDEELPIASLTKIMTVIVALENSQANDEVTVLRDPFNDHGGNKLKIGEKWRIFDLAKFTLISSSNSGAFVLSNGDDYSFLEKMNQKARRIGMENTLFLNSTGIDINDERVGAFASAKDINILTMYAYKGYPEVFHATVLPEMQVYALSGEFHQIYNTNYILNKIPNILFSKTGNTVMAGGNLAIIFKDNENHEIVVTVLGSTTEGRFSDMEKIINVLQYNHGISNQNLR